MGSAGRVDALGEHELEAALELWSRARSKRGQRGVWSSILLALERAAAADLAGFAQQRPAAEQVGLAAAAGRNAGLRGRQGVVAAAGAWREL